MLYIEILLGILAVGGAGVGFAKFKSSRYESTGPTRVSAQELPALMQQRLDKTRDAFSATLAKVRSSGSVDAAFWNAVEEMLLVADVGLATTEHICSEAQKMCKELKITTVDNALDAVKAQMLAIFTSSREPVLSGKKPNVWLFVGVNGVGKTTSIAKIGHNYRTKGNTVLFVAGDTFRAAAADQLETWATRTDSDIVRSNEGADPASVVFDGMEKANAKNYDVVLVDTAGRLHTKSNLMEEVKKIRRVVERTADALKEVLIVIDASTGQNGLVQAREFSQAVGVTGVVLSKLDGSSKGGIAMAIEHELGVPVKWVGLGEGENDLIPFEPKEYVDALLS